MPRPQSGAFGATPRRKRGFNAAAPKLSTRADCALTSVCRVVNFQSAETAEPSVGDSLSCVDVTASLDVTAQAAGYGGNPAPSPPTAAHPPAEISDASRTLA